MQFNEAGLNLIREFEGCALEAYRDQGGVLSVGFGCTHHVTEGMTITPQEAVDRLKEDVQETERLVRALVEPRQLTDNQFSACICLCFNIGYKNFKSSTLLNCIRMGNFQDAAQEFLKWVKVNGVPSAGLLNRRLAEKALFQA